MQGEQIGGTSKMKGFKIDRIEWEIHVILRFGLWACMHVEYPRPIHRTESSDILGGLQRNEWAVGTRAYTHKRKAETKYLTCISHSIRSILQPFILDVAPNLLTLHAPQ